MKRISILDRYIARQVAGPFALAVVMLTFALVSARMLKLTDMVINHGVTLGEIVGLIGYVMPAFLELVLPMAVLLGVLMGFGRMSGDHEMTAARSLGVSLYRLAAPVMVFALAVYGCSSWFAFSLRPWANARLGEEIYQLTRTRTSTALKEKVFNRNLTGLVVYVDEISGGGSKLEGVLISDGRDRSRRNTIIAHRGLLIADHGGRSVTLRLFDGSVFGVDPDGESSHVTSFDSYDLTVRPPAARLVNNLRPEETAYGDLQRRITAARATGKPDFPAEAEMASKYTLPFATILFALLGISLGLKPARGGHSERFGISGLLFFLYYILMKVGRTLAEDGTINAFLALSIPDLAFAALAGWLFYRAATDRSGPFRGPGDFLWEFVESFQRTRATA